MSSDQRSCDEELREVERLTTCTPFLTKSPNVITMYTLEKSKFSMGVTVCPL